MSEHCEYDEREPEPKRKTYSMCLGCNGGGKDLRESRYPEDCGPCYACGGTGYCEREE